MRKRNVLETQDHYVISDAMRQTFVGEFVPTSGTGEAIGAGLIKFVEEKKGINMDEVRILGGDSCAANGGKCGGVL